MRDARWESKKEKDYPQPDRKNPGYPSRSPNEHPEKRERSPDHTREDRSGDRGNQPPKRGGDDPTTDW
jgi:hypothetical protein